MHESNRDRDKLLTEEARATSIAAGHVIRTQVITRKIWSKHFPFAAQSRALQSNMFTARLQHHHHASLHFHPYKLSTRHHTRKSIWNSYSCCRLLFCVIAWRCLFLFRSVIDSRSQHLMACSRILYEASGMWEGEKIQLKNVFNANTSRWLRNCCKRYTFAFHLLLVCVKRHVGFDVRFFVRFHQDSQMLPTMLRRKHGKLKFDIFYWLMFCFQYRMITKSFESLPNEDIGARTATLLHFAI